MRIEPNSKKYTPPTTEQLLLQNPQPRLFASCSSLSSGSTYRLKNIGQNVLSLLTAVVKWIKSFFCSPTNFEPSLTSTSTSTSCTKSKSYKFFKRQLLNFKVKPFLEKRSSTSLFSSAPEITEKQKKDLNFILKILSTDSRLKITSYFLPIEIAKRNIKDIHPLKFLEYALSPTRRPLLQKISSRKDFKIGEQFQDELINQLKTHARNKEFLIYLQGFVESLFSSYKLTMDYNFINHLIGNNQWRELLDYLINK